MRIDLESPTLFQDLLKQSLPDLKSWREDFNIKSVSDENKPAIISLNTLLEEFEKGSQVSANQVIKMAEDLILEKVFETSPNNIDPNERERVLNEFSLVAHEYLWVNPNITLEDLMELQNGSREVAIKIINNLIP